MLSLSAFWFILSLISFLLLLVFVVLVWLLSRLLTEHRRQMQEQNASHRRQMMGFSDLFSTAMLERTKTEAALVKSLSKSLGLLSVKDPIAFQQIEVMGQQENISATLDEERSIDTLLELYMGGFETDLSEAEVVRVNKYVADGTE